jgi:zinc protease
MLNLKLSKILIILSLLYGSYSYAEVSKFQLDNGLKFIVIPNHRSPVVMHMVWYDVGGLDDPLKKSGIAHFLEHLMFTGTTNFTKGKLTQIIHENGGILNAMTYHDGTAYYEMIAKDKLPLMMELEADRMKNLILDVTEVDKERKVIIEERNMRVDNNPEELLQEQMQNVTYQNSLYMRPVIGWRHEMEKLSLDDAISMYQKFYAPNNATIVIAGDVTLDEVKKLAQKYYASIKPSNNLQLRTNLQEPTVRVATKLELIDSKVQQNKLFRYYLLPNLCKENLKKSLATMLLGSILFDDDYNILHEELVVKQKIASSIYGSYMPFGYIDTILRIGIIPNDKISLQDAEKSLDILLDNLVKTGITQEDLERAKEQIIASFAYEDENFVSQAYNYALLDKYNLPFDLQSDIAEYVKDINVNDVNEILKHYITKKNSTTGLLINDKK